MLHFVALNDALHKDLKINTALIEAQGAYERMVPVVLSEYLKLIVSYPIVFTKNAETGKFISVALLGFDERENLFWSDSKWDSIYLPLNISRQPFYVGDEAGETIICIDSKSPCIARDSEGEPLFEPDGGDTPYLQRMKSQLSQLLKGEQETRVFINALLELNLIMPMTLDISFANQQPQRVQGLYTINEERLAQLDAEQLLRLKEKNYLQPIYTMMGSLGQIYALIQKKNERLGDA
ncbi:MAG TPA: SapC family protein [Cellvibrio sp.]|nr:SapC family protein [Cellvibrio sp.]